ncbi:MAG: Gfo/Idh/MocA family oxidoreductase [Chloroflexi bacterium]|nr:Gfo/Idh/MocA family oxidoreductase [Chloroflexota bacterium]
MSTDCAPVLLVSSRLDEARERALRAALGLPDTVAIAHPSSAPSDLNGYQAVILDGPQESLAGEAIALLRQFVAAGGSLLALGAAPGEGTSPIAALLGAAEQVTHPWGEVFGKNADPRHELLRRVDAEFPLVDSFGALRPLNGDTRVLLNVNWGYHDEPAALERPLGQGRVVVSGLGNSVDALECPALRTILRRALRHRDEARPERPLGVGVVGFGPYGGMGFVHGAAIAQCDGLDLVAACDRAPERRHAARADFPTVRFYASADDLARDPDVDIVVVATPTISHAAISLAMLRAGKHVICEKPLCVNVEQANELISTARSHEVALTVHQNRRWDSDFLALRRAVDGGALGEIFNVETFVGDFAHPCRYWHSDSTISGGAIYDWGSHHTDWILQLMPGMPAVVSATAHKRVWHDVTNFDQVRVRLLWSDGREAEFFHSDVAAVRRPKFYLQGTAGTLTGHYRSVAFERIDRARGYVREQAHYAEAPAELTLARYDSGYGISETKLPLPPPQPFAFHRNLADHLHLGEPLAVTPESARRVIAVLEAAQQSASHGGTPVLLPDLA